MVIPFNLFSLSQCVCERGWGGALLRPTLVGECRHLLEKVGVDRRSGDYFIFLPHLYPLYVYKVIIIHQTCVCYVILDILMVQVVGVTCVMGFC